MCRGEAASTLALIFALQSVWPEWSIRMTLFFWNAGMKAFESGQIFQREMSKANFSLSFINSEKERSGVMHSRMKEGRKELREM